MPTANRILPTVNCWLNFVTLHKNLPVDIFGQENIFVPAQGSDPGFGRSFYLSPDK
jgi:hypothetical protein